MRAGELRRRRGQRHLHALRTRLVCLWQRLGSMRAVRAGYVRCGAWGVSMHAMRERDDGGERGGNDVL